ncbi:hypothetical protein H0H93_006054, partial [Arthromyces matolae]
MTLSPSDMEEEETHFVNVITTFRNYERYSLAANNRRRKDIYRLLLADQQVLGELGYKQKLDQVDDAIRANAEFLSLVVAEPQIFAVDLDSEGGDAGEDTSIQDGNERSGEQGYQHTHPHSNSHSHSSHTHDHTHDHGHDHGHDHSHRRRQKYKPTDFDMDKLRSTLKQFVRDWSEEGREEREACYEPMKDALVEHFSNVPIEERSEYRNKLRVLVPGSGLGRLAYDVARM